ncbi:hypothetical protein [Roseimaritima sediminicola]|uniref:hypothetical protein n=1 Tax=Roseimaritima sediminicola TaxID=2662066 RepID=UPI0012984A1B|nr:hypothetical protein [Roseimaritima sediminicola]
MISPNSSPRPNPYAAPAVVVFLINYNGWGPPEGNRPITLMAFTYAALLLPTAAWLVFAPGRTGDHSHVERH